MKARRVELKAVYDGQDISLDISSFIKSFSVREVIGGEADSADITLQDREELWINSWFPDRGSTMELSIVTYDWNNAGDCEELPMGKFEIDEIENSCPPNEVKIKLVSIPNNAEIRSKEKSRSWEKAKLSVVAKDIAEDAEMELFYDTAEDPVYDRVEQSEQTDLSLLLKLCKDAGLALKVTDGKIAIFDIAEFEKKDPVATLIKGQSNILSFQGKSTIHEIYKACHVKYKQGQKNELIEYTYTDPNKEQGMTLEVNEKVSTVEEAEKLAKKKLRAKNQEEVKVSIQTAGNTSLLAGLTVQLQGFYIYDGKYIICNSTHAIGNGYTTSVELKRCLNGY